MNRPSEWYQITLAHGEGSVTRRVAADGRFMLEVITPPGRSPLIYLLKRIARQVESSHIGNPLSRAIDRRISVISAQRRRFRFEVLARDRRVSWQIRGCLVDSASPREHALRHMYDDRNRHQAFRRRRGVTDANLIGWLDPVRGPRCCF